jgi:hypothetical protein
MLILSPDVLSIFKICINFNIENRFSVKYAFIVYNMHPLSAHNSTKVKIQASQAQFSIESSDSSDIEAFEVPHDLYQLDSREKSVLPESPNGGESSIRCLGLSLYH